MVHNIRYTNDCGDENLDQSQQRFQTKELQMKLEPFAREINEQEGVVILHTIENGRYKWLFDNITEDLRLRIFNHLDGYVAR